MSPGRKWPACGPACPSTALIKSSHLSGAPPLGIPRGKRTRATPASRKPGLLYCVGRGCCRTLVNPLCGSVKYGGPRLSGCGNPTPAHPRLLSLSLSVPVSFCFVPVFLLSFLLGNQAQADAAPPHQREERLPRFRFNTLKMRQQTANCSFGFQLRP